MMMSFSLLFIGLSSLIACLGALLVGKLVPAVSVLALVLALGISCYLSRKMTLKLQAAPVSGPIFLLYALIFTGIYFHSVFFFFQKGPMYWIQNPFNLGDMSFHWGAINYLAEGAKFWPENPIYLGYRFKYPFGMDFFNSIWGNLGVPISYHLPLVTLLALLVVFYALHITGGPLLVFAIFFSSGFYNFLVPGPWELNRMQESLDFKNLFLTVLLTQRGFLYALPAGVFLFRAIQKVFAGEWRPTTLEKVTLGIIWGALGFFHLHSFFFLSLYFGVLILYKRDLKNWVLPISVASVLGFPFVINALLPETGTNSLVHLNARGWNRAENVNPFLYWVKNLGPWIVAVVAALTIFYRKKQKDPLLYVSVAAGLFVVFMHVILAPWPWDNIKIILWCYVLALMGMSDLLWNQRKDWMKAVVFAIFFIPGMMIFVRSLPAFNKGTQWASEKELNKARVLLKGQDVNQGLMVAPNYDHPALLLGYKLYMGYPGHVWSHGYNYVEREALLNRVYSGDEAAIASLPKDQVGLVYRGPLEKRRENVPDTLKGLSKINEALDHELYLVERK
ncbi:hypothetical protein [Bdellovibrio sp. HCB337]|uniref:hypothetical protein n=1 Tax=Bdellovibrio sp. HCB337 TaxID=3394358 RepID=UPI0039A44A88